MAEQLTRVPAVPHVQEVESSNLQGRQNLIYTALQMVCHHFNIYASSCVALVL